MPCHTTNIVQKWFEEEFFILIEHLWDVLKKLVRSYKDPSRKLQDLKDKVLAQILHALIGQGNSRKVVLRLWLIVAKGGVP